MLGIFLTTFAAYAAAHEVSSLPQSPVDGSQAATAASSAKTTMKSPMHKHDLDQESESILVFLLFCLTTLIICLLAAKLNNWHPVYVSGTLASVWWFLWYYLSCMEEVSAGYLRT